jgi:hypothetical protein
LGALAGLELERARIDRREIIAAAGTVAAAVTASQAFAQMAAEEPMMHPPQDKALEARGKRGAASPDKTCCQDSLPM